MTFRLVDRFGCLLLVAAPAGQRADRSWAKFLLMSLDDARTASIRYLIRDNAGYFTEGFDAVFTSVGALSCQ